MDELLTSIAAKKKRIDELRPLLPKVLANLEHYYDIELTYTSNAIEGNTLSPVETTLVIEKGITVSGKPLKDHLEALDHYDAIRDVRELGRQGTPLTEGDVRNIHKLVMQRSAPEVAGRYADQPRYVRTETGRYTFPSAAVVPPLMGDFAAWLSTAPNTAESALNAHRRLVDIHPFNEGNGRTARLLMNLILIGGGYPPVAVRPEDRLEYIRSLQEEQAGESPENFNALLYRRLDETLGEYLSALQEAGTGNGNAMNRAVQSRSCDVGYGVMQSGELFFVAVRSEENGERVLGFSSYRVEEGKHRTAVYVRGDAAHMGIGKALFDKAETAAREHGVLEIHVDASLAAVNFYKACGFEEVAAGQHRLRTGDVMDCVFMKKKVSALKPGV